MSFSRISWFLPYNANYHSPSICRLTVEQLNNEITMLDKRIKTITKQIELPMTEQDIKDQMTDFLIVSSADFIDH